MSTAAAPSNTRSLLPWFIAIVLHSYAVTIFSVASFDYADKRLHASASTRLWLMAVWGFAYIFISLASGKITSRLGARKTLLLMLPLCVVAELLCLLIFPFQNLSWSPWLLALLMIPLNITSSSCWPALETAVSQSPSPMPLSTRMAIYNLSWSLTGFAAIFTRGTLENLHWSLIFIAPALVTLITYLVLAIWSIPQHMLSQEHLRIAPDDPSEKIENHKSQIQNATTLLHMAWIGNALAYVAINVSIPVLMLLATAAFTSSPSDTGPSLIIAGFVTSAWGFTHVAGFLITMKWTGWHYKARWLVGSQVALALSFFAMLSFHHPLTLILSQIVFGLATALIYSSSLYYAMHTSEGEGGHAGFHEALIGMGICLGPTIGALAGSGNDSSLVAQLTALHRIAWAVTALLLLGTLAMAVLAMRRPKTPATLQHH